MTARSGLSAVAGVLEGWLPVAVLLAAAAGFTAPGVGRLADAHGGIPGVLAVLVLTAGASVEVAGLRRLRGASVPIAVTVVASTAVLPALAWLAGRLVTDPALRNGVLAAGVAPAEVASIGLAAAAGTDTALAAIVLIASTIATVVLAGPLLSLLAGTTAGASQTGLLSTLALVVALPLVVGIAVRARWPHATPVRAAAPLGNLALLLLVYLVAAQIPHSSAYLPVVPALLVYVAGAVGLGWLLARPFTPARRLAVLLPVAMRDFAVAAGVATTAFGPAAAAPLGLYGVLVLGFGALSTTLARRHG